MNAESAGKGKDLGVEAFLLSLFAAEECWLGWR